MQVYEVPLGWPEPFPPKIPPRLEDSDTDRERSPSDRRRPRFVVPSHPGDVKVQNEPDRVPAYVGKLDLMA